MENPINIIIVDDHPIFRRGLASLLKEIPNTKVIAEASNGNEFLEILETKKPDFVFMDIKMPVMTGDEATKIALEKYPELKIVALSVFGDEEYLDTMIEAGVDGFLLKNSEKSEIEKAINMVLSGKNYFSDSLIALLTKKIYKKRQEQKAQKYDEVKLTSREIEILKLICQEYSNSEIAEMLHLSQRTIDSHRANLLSKIGTKKTIGLVLYAIKNQLIEI